jgi:two-component system sensor histidine kinase TctE
LTIVERIAHLHGAKVSLETGEGGAGLVVNVIFPAA